MFSRFISQVVRFAAVGLAGFTVDAGLTMAFAKSGLPPWAARLPAIGAAMFLTWWLNRRFTFRVNAPFGSLLPYALVAAIAAVANYGIFVVLVDHQWSVFSSIVAATAVSMIVSFFGYRGIAFRVSS